MIIGSVQLAHTKVGVGVTQANLGHGWPKFSPMDGLLGLSIPYPEQYELASTRYEAAFVGCITKSNYAWNGVNNGQKSPLGICHPPKTCSKYSATAMATCS